MSKLQTQYAVSTAESEYIGLSKAMLHVKGTIYLLEEIKKRFAPDIETVPKIHCKVFEDNSAALQLATKQRITNRTRYYHVKWHWFWDKVIRPDNPNGIVEVLRVDTHNQKADYLTKQPPRHVFENLRNMVQGW